MWNKLRTSISTPRDPLSSREVGYTAIGTNDDPLESTSPINSPRASAAVSHQRGVYWAFWILGAGVLLAWNVLICTMPLLSSFFMEEDPHRTNLASWLSSVYCFGNLFFLGLAQRDAGRMSPSSALRSSLVLLFILSLLMAFPLTPILLPALSSNTLLFPLLIILTLLLALSTAILQWAVFALASLWGSQEMLGVMSGQGGIAVLVSGAQVFLAIFSALGTGGGETAGQSRMAGVGLWALGAIGAGVCMAAHRFLVRHPEYEKVMEPLYIRQDGNERKNGSEISRKVFKKNILLEIAVAWVFVVTLSVFPPITSRILSVDTTPGAFHQPSVFIPVHFLLFNIGDYVGRTYLSNIPALLTTNHSRVLLWSFSRTLFIPLFLACNVVGRTSTPWINSDTFYFLILFAFGASNGWISSISMILASSPALNPRIMDEEKDVAGTLAAFCLVAGLAGGSVLSFGVSYMVGGSALV